MINRFWNLTLQYSVGFLCLRAVSFLLLPLYTNLLTTKEAGFIFIIYTILAFLNTLYSFGMDSSLLKFYHLSKPKTVISTSLFYSLLICAPFSFLLLLVGSFFFSFLPPVDVFFTSNISLIFVVILFCDMISSRIMQIVRLLEKPYYFLFVGLMNVFVSLFCNFYFIKELHLGLSGAVLSLVCVSLLQLFCLMPIVFSNFRLQLIDSRLFVKMLKFSLPFVPAALFFMLIEMSDRWMIAWLSSVENVGLYGAGYKIGGFMLLLVRGFNLNWQPYYLKQDAGSCLKKFNLIGSTFIVVMIFFSVLLSVFWPVLFNIKIGSLYFVGVDFWEGGVIIPIICVAYVFYGIFILQMPSIYLKNKEGWVVVFWGVGVFVNFILNYFMIPVYGFLGAAIGTLFAYLMMALLLIYKNRFWLPIKYDYKKIFSFLLLSLGFYASFLLFTNSFLIFCFLIFTYFSISLFYLYKIQKS